MGAGQSSGGASAAADDVEVKESYYVTLGVERTATDDEIKKAYRRKALELHPDRNYGDVDRATALFAEVQSAYEVLSDPQERAWYDAHEGDILRGGAGEAGGEDHFEHNMRVTTADDIARMMGKFKSNVEFTDAPTGFFGFVRETFEQLAKEEEAAADWENIEVPDYPSFGHKDDTYEDVVRDFYAAWNGFATKKTFAWKDKYRLSEAPDRRIRRLMEKENKRFREEGVREFNDAVRALLLFVRRRDPRYTPNTQTADERAKEQRAAAKEQAAKARAARATQMEEQVPEWATRRDPEDEVEEEEDESEEEHFECVACHKTFKSEKQYDAHEKSKKHQKAIQALKRQMRKDNAHLNLDEDITISEGIKPIDSDEEDRIARATLSHEFHASVNDVADDIASLDIKPNPANNDWEDEDAAENEDEDEAEDQATTSASDSDYASRSDIEARLSRFRTSSTSQDPLNPDTKRSFEPASSEPKLGKAAQKRAKKAAKQAELNDADLKHKCAVCQSPFPSKTELFQHIKDFGHAAPVGVARGAGGGGGGGGKKKGKKK